LPMARVRLFVAVRIAVDDRFRAVMTELGRIGRPVRVTAEENLHVTLSFLGGRDESEVGPIIGAVREATMGEMAFRGELVGLGAFPNRKQPRVVWVGLHEEGRLGRMAASVYQWLDAAGLAPEPESRAWTAHVTVARVGSSRGRMREPIPGALSRLLEQYGQTRFGSVDINAVELIASELHATGPVYTTVERIALGGVDVDR